MTPGAHIQTFIELLDEIIRFSYPADKIVHSFFKKRRFCGSKDRKQINAWLYNFLRHYAQINKALESLTNEPNALLYAFSYLILIEQKTLSELQTLCNGLQYHPKPISPFMLTMLQGVNLSEGESIECPEWLLTLFQAAYRQETNQLIKALNQEAPCDIRTNTIRIKRSELKREFDLMGIPTQETSFSPWGLRVDRRINITDLELFRLGYFEIQDEGSQRIALLTSPKPNDYVIDLCAGACGKTLALAALMNNKGRLVACDIDQKRLENGKKRIKRAGANNIQLRCLDQEGQQWLKRQYGKADIVLLDAPCSGTGTWRRNPDHKWRILPQDLEELIQIQADLLDRASKLVKPEGKIVYATCSLLPQENEEQIDKFLKKNPQFQENKEFCFKALPHKDNTDGFFMSTLVLQN